MSMSSLGWQQLESEAGALVAALVRVRASLRELHVTKEELVVLKVCVLTNDSNGLVVPIRQQYLHCLLSVIARNAQQQQQQQSTNNSLLNNNNDSTTSSSTTPSSNNPTTTTNSNNSANNDTTTLSSAQLMLAQRRIQQLLDVCNGQVVVASNLLLNSRLFYIPFLLFSS